MAVEFDLDRKVQESKKRDALDWRRLAIIFGKFRETNSQFQSEINARNLEMKLK